MLAIAACHMGSLAIEDSIERCAHIRHALLQFFVVEAQSPAPGISNLAYLNAIASGGRLQAV